MLAREAGVQPSDVAMAGLKDRQGVTIQYMSVPGGRAVDFESPELRIEPVGRLDRAISSADSRGNAFEITARALDGPELNAMRRNLPIIREMGVVNYFDDQRFGNLRHGIPHLRPRRILHCLRHWFGQLARFVLGLHGGRGCGLHIRHLRHGIPHLHLGRILHCLRHWF